MFSAFVIFYSDCVSKCVFIFPFFVVILEWIFAINMDAFIY